MARTFARFLLVGMVNTFLGISVTFALRYGPGLGYWPATLGGWLTGATTSFLLNRKYTFRSDAPIPGALLRFAAVLLICYFIAFEIGAKTALLLSQPLGIHPMQTDDAAVWIGTAVYTIINYWGQKKWVHVQRSTPMCE